MAVPVDAQIGAAYRAGPDFYEKLIPADFRGRAFFDPQVVDPVVIRGFYT
jgi:hypothetical protein